MTWPPPQRYLISPYTTKPNKCLITTTSSRWNRHHSTRDASFPRKQPRKCCVGCGPFSAFNKTLSILKSHSLDFFVLTYLKFYTPDFQNLKLSLILKQVSPSVHGPYHHSDYIHSPQPTNRRSLRLADSRIPYLRSIPITLQHLQSSSFVVISARPNHCIAGEHDMHSVKRHVISSLSLSSGDRTVVIWLQEESPVITVSKPRGASTGNLERG